MTKQLRISVVIPCYNAVDWLPETLNRAQISLKNANIAQAEIIVVDDGSADGSADIAKVLKLDYPVKVITQTNQGRFLARKNGVLAAQYENIFFLDTRVYLGDQAISFIAEQMQRHPDRRIWNGHVNVAKEGNIIARFMDAVTFIGWRRYFAHPKTTSYGLKYFDYYPKGTGCFIVPKNILIDAINEFEATTTDLKHSSDDTLLIRILAQESRINLSPEFSCTYFARTNLKEFIGHTYSRGQFFVDGFLRRGTRFYLPIVVFLCLSIALVALLIMKPTVIYIMLPIAVLLWVFELIMALLLKVPVKDALSLFILTPLFTACYGIGIWRGVLRKLKRALN